MVTRAQFAPLLKTALSAVTIEIIMNRFRKFGLFPFDADAIDYTKGMTHGSRNEEIDKSTEIRTEHLLYFECLMPSNRVLEFRAVPHGDSRTGAESAKELFYTWRKITQRIAHSIVLLESSEMIQNQQMIRHKINGLIKEKCPCCHREPSK